MDTQTKAQPESRNVVNTNLMTTISNSAGEFNIYTYAAKNDSASDLRNPRFFDPAYTFLVVGDTIRVFGHEHGELSKYYEFIVMKIDKDNRKVTTSLVREIKLESRLVVEQ